MYNSRIAGMGAYVPENVVTNDDLSKMMDTNDAWIQERTGIQERRHIKDGDGNTIATFRISKSIEDAGGDVVLNASRYGPINFPLPLICKTKLRYGPASNTQSSILYRDINKNTAAFPSTYSD